MTASVTYTPISSYTVSGSSTSSITFNSLGSYTDLRFVLNVAGDTLNAFVKANFNGDTTASYSGTTLYGNGTSASSSRYSAGGGSQIWVTNYVSFSQTLGESVFTFDVMNYSNSTTYKTCLIRGNRASSTGSWYGAEAQVAIWRNANAITSVVFATTSGYFVANSVISLYGIAAA